MIFARPGPHSLHNPSISHAHAKRENIMLIIAEIMLATGVLGLLGQTWLVARDLPRSNDDFIFY